jgi:murein DD-endopeptidase MepM/ murein hydrolase activator NlpD
MREAATPVRRLRMRRLVLVLAGVGLLGAAAAHVRDTYARLHALEKELDWTQRRLAERREMVRQQRDEIAQLAAGIDRAARVTAGARERASKLRRLARLEESREPETSPLKPVTIPDTGEALVSEPTAEAIEQLAWLEGQTSAINDSVTLLSTLVQNGTADGGTPPWLWPVSGPISSEFGGRWSPYGHSYEFHPGLDIRATSGTPVTATGGGIVVFAGRMNGYGNMVVVDHGFELKTVYAHLSAVYMDVGQRVQAGDVVGTVGQTGRATGPHLHYEVRVGAAPVDPLCYLDGPGRYARPLALTMGG